MIDVGINRTEAGLVGDVAFAAAAERARADHARAGRRRPDDDRDAAAQHAARGQGAGGLSARPAPGRLVAGVAGAGAAGRRCSCGWYTAARAARTASAPGTRSRSSTCCSRSSPCSGSRSRVSQVARRGPALPVALEVITADARAGRDAARRSTGIAQPARPQRRDRRGAGGLARRSPAALGALPRRLAGAQRRAPAPVRSAAARARAPPDAGALLRSRAVSHAHRDQVLHVATPRPPRAHRGGGRALRHRALERARPHRDDRRARRHGRRRADLARRGGRERAARRRAAASLPQADALAGAPDAAQGGFRVPSPGAGGGG